MAISGGLSFADGVRHLRDVRTVDAYIKVRRLTAFAAQELVDGHSRLPPFDVPQGLVDSANRVVEHRPVSPIGTVVHGLPQVLDPVRRPPDQKRTEVLLHGGHYQVRALCERGAAVAVEPILIGDNLHHDQSHVTGLDHNDLHIPD